MPKRGNMDMDPEFRGFSDNLRLLERHLAAQIELLERNKPMHHVRGGQTDTPADYISHRKQLGILSDVTDQLRHAYELYGVGFIGPEIHSYTRPHMTIIEGPSGVSYRGDEMFIEATLKRFLDTSNVAALEQYVRTTEMEGIDVDGRNILATQIRNLGLLAKRLCRSQGDRGDS